MAAGGFFGGAVSGFADTALKKKNKGTPSGAKKLMSKMSKKGGSSDSFSSMAPPSQYQGSGGDGNSAGSFKRGGRVRRTGRARVHKGERVLTAKQARKYEGKRRGGKRR
jgi:hypothetical protein